MNDKRNNNQEIPDPDPELDPGYGEEVLSAGWNPALDQLRDATSRGRPASSERRSGLPAGPRGYREDR